MLPRRTWRVAWEVSLLSEDDQFRNGTAQLRQICMALLLLPVWRNAKHPANLPCAGATHQRHSGSGRPTHRSRQQRPCVGSAAAGTRRGSTLLGDEGAGSPWINRPSWPRCWQSGIDISPRLT